MCGSEPNDSDFERMKVFSVYWFHVLQITWNEMNSVKTHNFSDGFRNLNTKPVGALKDLACANPTCWFLTSPDEADGGYCCKKCHWRHVPRRRPMAMGFLKGSGWATRRSWWICDHVVVSMCCLKKSYVDVEWFKWLLILVDGSQQTQGPICL